jgi:hypothetical protein
LLGEQQSSRDRQFETFEKAEALFAKEIAAPRQHEIVLGSEQEMDSVAQHRALSHEKAALPKHLLDLAGLWARNMDRRNLSLGSTCSSTS